MELQGEGQQEAEALPSAGQQDEAEEGQASERLKEVRRFLVVGAPARLAVNQAHTFRPGSEDVQRHSVQGAG